MTFRCCFFLQLILSILDRKSALLTAAGGDNASTAPPIPEARTYHLLFDAIVSPDVVVHHASDPRNNHPSEPYSKLVPPTIAEEVSATIGPEFLGLWLRHRKKQQQSQKTSDADADGGSISGEGEGAGQGLNCFPGEGSADFPPSTTCLVDHAERDVSFRLSVTTYSPHGVIQENGRKYGSEQGAVSDDADASSDTDTSIVPVAARIDATMTGPDQTFVRQALVNAVPKSIKQIQSPSDPPPIWSVQERPSPCQMSRRLYDAYSTEQRASEDDENTSCSSALSKWRDTRAPLPLESTVLSNTTWWGEYQCSLKKAAIWKERLTLKYGNTQNLESMNRLARSLLIRP